MRIGIMGAMSQEVGLIVHNMNIKHQEKKGGRIYNCGQFGGKSCVVVQSGWGKVASSSTAATLITHFDAEIIIFTGVAGGIDEKLNIGDVVIGTEFIQHDLDARPIYPRYQIPLLNISKIKADKDLSEKAAAAAKEFIVSDIKNDIDIQELKKVSITKPKVVQGLIASGDQFIASKAKVAKLRKEVKGAKCVEMEGAAVAQVCYEYEVGFAVIRVISDKADHKAKLDFPRFLDKVASHYSLGILKNMIVKIQE
jgi:adenosylhomocysteine nucleosidase